MNGRDPRRAVGPEYRRRPGVPVVPFGSAGTESARPVTRTHPTTRAAEHLNSLTAPRR